MAGKKKTKQQKAQTRARLCALRGACLLLLFLLPSPQAFAASWTGAVSTDWFNAGNWSGGVPTGAENAVIEGASTNMPTISTLVAANAVTTVGNETMLSTLTIFGGADLSSSGLAVLADRTGMRGRVIVTDPGTSWTNASSLIVGNGWNGSGAEGTLYISNGGSVFNTSGTLANNTGSTGTATVIGTGSTWTNSAEMTVGYSGNGTLSIQNGASVSNTGGYIGYNAGSAGTVAVTGAGSTWTNSSSLLVGRTGIGHLTISDGGVVSNVLGYVGSNTGSTGTATVTGAGSRWINSGSLYIANNTTSTGTLTISNGGFLSNTSGTLGNNAGTSGTATVTGAGSSWINSSNLTVGGSGTGTLNIQNGAAVSNTSGYIGNTSVSTGTVAVTGAGSTWTNSGEMTVGYSGNGTLSIQNGATVSNATGHIGRLVGSTGIATVTGTGSTWNNNLTLCISFSGTGTLNILSGGAVTNNGQSYIGQSTNSNGTVTINGLGSRWTSVGRTHVGLSGTGTLNIFDGAQVFSQESARIGNSSGSHGYVSVSGTGSRWEITQYLYISHGWDGASTGNLTISDGGFVSNTYAHIGDAINAIGAVTVADAGSSWVNSSSLIVGRSGVGTLNIQNGANVSSTSGYIASNASSTGTATVTGAGSTWTNSSSLAVGNSGTGTLTVSDDGSVSTTALTIAANAGSVGKLNIGAAEGAAAVAAGRVQTPTVTFGAGTGTLVFNHTNGCGNGGLLCDGATGSAQAYDFTAALSGAGSIKALSGVTAMTGNLSGFTGSLSVSEAARLDVLGAYGGSASIASGGVLSANNNLTGPVAVNNGGTLKGSGSIGSMAVASGGTLAPGNSIGTIAVVGNVSFAVGSFYDVEIDAAGNSDLTTATGNATLNGGTVTLLPEAGGLYRAGTTYTILHADGGVAGAFDAIALSSASLFLTATLSYDADDVFASLARNGTSFASTAISFNEQQAAVALDQSGSANDAFNAVTGLSTSAAARDAFALLSGELHADIKADLSQTRSEANALLLARMAQAKTDGKNLWAAPLTSARKLDGEGGQTAPFAATTNGVFFGVDAPQADGSVFGLAFGFARTDYKLDARGGTASGANADHYHLAAYHVRQAGPLRLNFAAAYDGHQIESARRFTIGGTSTAPTATYQAHGFGGMVDAAYPIVQTDLYSLEAHGGIEHALLYISDFKETGGSGALSATDDLSNAGATTLGLKATQTLALTHSSDPVAVLSLGLDWRRALASSRTQGLYAFAGSDPFAAEAAPAPRDAIILSGGAQMRLSPAVSLNLDALSSFNDAGSSFTARSALSLRF